MAETKLLTPFAPYDLLTAPFAELSRWPLSPLFSMSREFPMRIEEFADDGHLIVRAELPGVDPDKDIEIVVEAGMLTIRGERRSETKTEKKGEHFSEMQYGSFSRTIALPEGIGEQDVTATYRDGILEVRLPVPKAPAAKPATRIEVKH